MAVVDQVFTSSAMHAVIRERDEVAPGGVTVCIPYYNEPIEMLGRAVRSALDQTEPPREVIIIDDGSRWPEIPESFSPEAKVVHVTNRGLPSARNTALMLARGEFFLPLDSDDWIEPSYIEDTLPLIEKADVVLVGLKEHGEPPRNCEYMPGYNLPVEQITEQALWQMNRFFYCALMRTQLLKEIGGYHSRMAGWPGVNGGYEDWDLWIDLKHRQARFSWIDKILLNYTTKASSMLTLAERNKGILIDEMRRHHEGR